MHAFARCAIALIALGVTGSTAAEWTLVEERFYTLALAGKPCGRSLEVVERDGDRVRTRSRLEMRFQRLGEETVIDFANTFVETAAGDPVEAAISMNGAPELRYEFAPGAGASAQPTRVTVVRGATREEREIDAGEWLTPREISTFVSARVLAQAAEARYRSLDIQSGLVPVEIGMRRGGSEKLRLGDRSIDVLRYTVTNSLIPVEANERYDAKGALVMSTTPIGLGDLVSSLATKAEADASYAAASYDLLAGTFVATKPIVRWADRTRLALEVRAKGDALIDLPTTGSQAVRRVDGRTAIIDVDTMRASGALPGDVDDPRWLKSNDMIDSDSTPIRELLAKAKLPPRVEVTGEKGAQLDLLARADRLRTLVAKHLRDKNLATAFASASEAARARGGDCTEHAVLLAALLRADGIPSRVVSGLVYVPDLGGKGPGFGWHLWTQALVHPPFVAGGFGRAWVDFDATLAGDARFHAGHIAVATSDLAGGASDPAFAQALSLVGGVEISEVDGVQTTTPVQPSASAESPQRTSTPAESAAP